MASTLSPASKSTPTAPRKSLIRTSGKPPSPSRSGSEPVLLNDRTAIVYGGSGAVGGAVAKAYAREGARVFLAARNRERLTAVAAEITAAGEGSRWRRSMPPTMKPSRRISKRSPPRPAP
ncbi:MAG TPA: SDR family NAD(P)-dependent oxidoreductase [Devosia sp.]|nr:SDR family NAD(P)-dependent oxidoreductase [Devosia sp.]HEV2517114.1 SDR family NAD(P)-dependent oxidoreductase [Devosia sp.]